jgi:TfoX/Sxy family transcriptional regulator of competence genes
MAYSEFLADRVRQRLKSVGTIVEKKMMGGLIFMVNDKMCIGIDKDKHTLDDRLMVRVGKDAYKELLKKKGCREMDFTGKAIKGFLFIYPIGFDKETDLDFWINKALDFNKEAKEKITKNQSK